MAKPNDLEVRLIATDDASKVIDKVADNLDDLEKKGDQAITIKAEDKASDPIDDLIQRLDKLSAEDRYVVIGARADEAQKDIDRILRALTQVEQMDDEEIEIRLRGLEQARGDLDKLNSELKAIEDVTPTLDTSKLRRSIDNVSGSAKGANNALANMIGNTSQDLGAMAGLAGGAGVAIGQMGEYAADAALDGEKLSSSLLSMAKVAGPIAGIALAFQLVQSEMAKNKRTAAEYQAQFDSLLEKIKDADSATGGLVDQFQDLGAVELKMPGAKQFLGTIGDMGGGTLNVTERLDELGISAARFAEIAQGGIPAITRWRDAQLEKGRTWDQINGVIVALEIAHRNLADVELELALRERVLGDEEKKRKKGIDSATRSLLAKAEAQKDVNKETKRAAREEAEAAKALDDTFTDQINAAVAAGRAIGDLVDDMIDAEAALLDLDSTFSNIGFSGDALRSIFDLKNAPLDSAADIRDVALAIDDLSVAAEGVDLSAPLDPSNVNADQLLDAFDALRPQIQAKIVEAFSVGGEEAAMAMANDYIAQVAEELDISEVEAAKLLGLDDIKATIHVAVHQTEMAKARAQLEILAGMGSADPVFVAEIGLALDAGTLDPVKAQRMILRHLADLGVTIPAGIVPFVDRTARDGAKADLDETANPNRRPRKAGIEANANTDGAKADLDELTAPRIVEITPVWQRPVGFNPEGLAGGTSMGTHSTTLMVGAHGATTTSAVAPMAAPVIVAGRPQATTNVNVVVQAAVIGGPFDVMRAVEDTMRRIGRLQPVRP